MVATDTGWASCPWGLARRLSSLLCLCSCFMGLSWAETQRGSWGEGPAGWWERDQRPLLAHRQPITPCPSRRGEQASLSFLPHVLAHQVACRPITTDFSFPGCIFTGLHLVKKKVGLWSGGHSVFCRGQGLKAKLWPAATWGENSDAQEKIT